MWDCGGVSDIGAHLSSSRSGYPCQYRFSNVPFSFMYLSHESCIILAVGCVIEYPTEERTQGKRVASDAP